MWAAAIPAIAGLAQSFMSKKSEGGGAAGYAPVSSSASLDFGPITSTGGNIVLGNMSGGGVSSGGSAEIDWLKIGGIAAAATALYLIIRRK